MKLILVFITWSMVVDQVWSELDNCTQTSTRDEYKMCLQRLSEVLATQFRDIVIKELRSEYTTPLELRNSYKVNRHRTSDEETLVSISDKLTYKLSSAKNILVDMKNAIKDNSTPSFTHPCPFNSIRKSVFIKSANVDIQALDPKPSTGRFKDLKVKRQYFLSHMDYATDRDCTIMPHSNLRYLYHKIVHPDPKLIVFVIDNNMTSPSIQHAIDVVQETAYALQSSDMFALKMTNMSEFFKFVDMCGVNSMSDVGNATDNNKLLLREYLSALDATSASLSPFDIGAELTRLLEHKPLPKHKLFILLTDTKVLKNDTWLKVFPYTPNQIKDEYLNFAIGLIHENDVSKNSSLGILHIDKWHNHSTNHSVMRVHINDSGVLGQVASAFISLLPGNYEHSDIDVAGPVWEATERDFMISLVLPLPSGVIGLDLYWSDLAEDIVYFKSPSQKRRAFVIDFSGKVLMHTFYPRPESTSDKIIFTDIENVETSTFISEVKKEMLLKSMGNMTVREGNASAATTYSWRWVQRLYIVCLASEADPHADNNKTHFILTRSNKEILFHRLDLFPPKGGKMCRHFKQVATIDQGTVYLSPSSFESPFTYLYDMSDGQEAVTYMQNYLAYLKSVAHGLLSNPGLKNEIQQDVGFLNSILSFYKRQHLHGSYSNYIVRRYAVTESGVMIMFPGTVLEYDYEPVRRPWYTYAIDNPGKIILTPPNLDVGGAGYIVSISYAVKSSFHPTMVVSMDVTMGFLYKLLMESLPMCSIPHVKCFIMNNRGYLVSHPGLMGPNSSGPIEQQHITHKESMIAMDMLNHKGFVTKRLCNNFFDKTIQRYYEFNTSLPKVLSNIVSGEHQYYIAAVPGTNAFVGAVNASTSAGAFCPCSMVDRLCFNCNRMEQAECECPCECAARAPCAPEPPAPAPAPPDMPLCGLMLENNNHKSHYFHNFAENLKSCFDFQCESYTSHSSCLGVVGCEWCQIESDGRAALASPFCAAQASCFNGVVGAVTPYGSGGARDAAPGAGSALGPVAGCAVTAALVLAAAVYCYRQGAGGAGAWRGPDVPLARLPPDEPERGASGAEQLLPERAPVSPYRVVTGSRRRAAAASDHGYSTMTPHDDSEATGFSLTEPALLSDDARSEAGRPPRARRADAATALPPRHSVLAPVTVHRLMEAS